MMRFRILGPLHVRSGDGGWVGVGAANWRSVLACLLLRAGQVVPTETLISELWADSPPAMASNLVSIYAHRLRRLIGDADGRVLIDRASGYQLSIDPGDLDCREFESLVAVGRDALAAADPDAAYAALTEALGLWRGAFLADVPATPLIRAAARQMTELRLAADGLLTQAGLARGSTRSVSSARADPRKADNRADFGRELTYARNRAALSVHEVARAAGINPGKAAGYFTGGDLPGRCEEGLRTLHAILAACAITDPEQVIDWTYALMRAWSDTEPRQESPPRTREDAGAARQATPAAAPAVPDAPGFDLCPDPLTARSEADLVTVLSQFRVWAGEPSFREMERRCQHAAAAATMCVALGGSKLPSLRVVLAIVTSCGGTSEHQQAFATAWRRLRLAQHHDVEAVQQERPRPAGRPLHSVRDTRPVRHTA